MTHFCLLPGELLCRKRTPAGKGGSAAFSKTEPVSQERIRRRMSGFIQFINILDGRIEIPYLKWCVPGCKLNAEKKEEFP